MNIFNICIMLGLVFFEMQGLSLKNVLSFSFMSLFMIHFTFTLLLDDPDSTSRANYNTNPTGSGPETIFSILFHDSEKTTFQYYFLTCSGLLILFQMDDFMAELDEDVEGMQSTIMMLQQQLRYTQQTSQAEPIFFWLPGNTGSTCKNIPKQQKKL